MSGFHKNNNIVKLKFLSKTLGATLLAMMATGAVAQDLIARQAPIDRRMKNVNNVKINNTYAAAAAAAADLNEPAADIYTNWASKGVKNAEGYAPANMKVDLRGFAMPTPSRKVNSPFGPRWGKVHQGLDIKVYVGDTICAAFDGKVRIVDFEARGYGYFVVIRHPNGLETLYGHMSKQLVKPNQIVRAGEPIGLGGNTGRSFGSHLHFETRICGVPIDPALMFDFPHQDIKSDFFITKQSYGTRKSAVSATAARIATDNDRAQVAASAQAAEERAAAADNAAVEPVSVAAATPKASTAAAKNNKYASSKTKKKAAKSKTYQVKSGDNLSIIARRNGTTVDKLCKANGIKQNAILRPGQTLKY